MKTATENKKYTKLIIFLAVVTRLTLLIQCGLVISTIYCLIDNKALFALISHMFAIFIDCVYCCVINSGEDFKWLI